MHRRQFLQITGAVAAGLMLPSRSYAQPLLTGNMVSLKCLGHIAGPRFLEGRTVDGTVGLAPHANDRFSGTKWQVRIAGPNILLKCRSDIPGNRWLDGHTDDGTVGLAPRTSRPYSGTAWHVVQPDPDNPEIVALECMGHVDGPRWLDGRTANGSVGLAPHTNPPFTGTRWQVQLLPV